MMNFKVVFMFCASFTTLVIAGNHGSSGALSTQQRSQDISGEYSFSHDEKHGDWESFRIEKGDKDGSKVGSYGLKEADGRIRQVDYVADAHGFRATVNSNEPGVEGKSPAAAVFNAPQGITAGNIATTSLLAPTGPALASYGRVTLGHGLAQSAGAYGQVAVQSAGGYGGSGSPLVPTIAAPAVGAYGSAPVATQVSYATGYAHNPTIAQTHISAPIVQAVSHAIPVSTSFSSAIQHAPQVSGYQFTASTPIQQAQISAPIVQQVSVSAASHAPIGQSYAVPLSVGKTSYSAFSSGQVASGYGGSLSTSFAPLPVAQTLAAPLSQQPILVNQAPLQQASGYGTSFAPTPLSYAAAPAYGATPVVNVVQSPITGYSSGKTYALPSHGLSSASVKSQTVFGNLQRALPVQQQILVAPQKQQYFASQPQIFASPQKVLSKTYAAPQPKVYSQQVFSQEKESW